MSQNFTPKTSGWVMNHFGITRGKLAKYDEIINPKVRIDHQSKEKNQYREYQYDDIQKLWYIHMFSQMGMEIKEIKNLLDHANEFKFREAVIQRMEALEAEKHRLDGLISIAKMCRLQGRMPIPKDFVSVTFSEFREDVQKEWNCDKSPISRLMSGLSDYQLKQPADNDILEFFLSQIEDEFGKKIFELSEEESEELRELYKFDLYTVIETEALIQHIANLYPQDISSKEVMSAVKKYCIAFNRLTKDEDYPLNRTAEYMASQFYSGDQSVTLIKKYGNEKQVYISDAFQYFAENN